jgi:hypothetical protein
MINNVTRKTKCKHKTYSIGVSGGIKVNIYSIFKKKKKNSTGRIFGMNCVAVLRKGWSSIPLVCTGQKG